MAAQPLLSRSPRTRPAPAARRRLLLAVARDAATLAAALLGVGSLAVVWLLVRTDRGRVDVTAVDAALVVALVAAVLPAWAIWRSLAVADRLRPHGSKSLRRIAWYALHPRTALAWWWLAGSVALPMVTPLVVAGVVIALAVTLLAFGSLLLVLVRPDAAPLHDRIAYMGAAQ